MTTAGNASVFKEMPLDVRKDLVPIVGFAETPFVLCVAPDSPINSVAELTAFIKSKNGKATYGSATTSALASTALYLQKVGVTATYVGYKATATAIQDVNGHQIDFAFADVVFAMGQAKQGRIKILATASDVRSPALPDVPTLKELTGATTGDIVALWGVWVPAGTPKTIIDKLGDLDQRHHAFARNPKVPDRPGCHAVGCDAGSNTGRNSNSRSRPGPMPSRSRTSKRSNGFSCFGELAQHAAISLLRSDLTGADVAISWPPLQCHAPRKRGTQ